MRLVRILILIISQVIVYNFSRGQALNTQLRGHWDDNSLILQRGIVYNDLWGYADQNNREYAIVGSRQFTHFIDVTNPDAPVEVDREPGGTNCLWRDFKVYGHYAYGASDFCNGGLEIFDLSTLPDSVVKVYDSTEFLDDTHNIFIDTVVGRLYGCGLTNSSSDIVVLDISQNPAQPQLLQNIDLPDGYVHDIYVRNDTAYCSHIYARKMIIYDFKDLNSIRSIGMLSSPGANHSNWLSEDGNTLVIADETLNTPVIIADVSDKENPSEISSFKSTLLAPAHTNSIAHNPYIVGNKFAVISYYDDGLQIFKIDSSASPFQAAYYDTDTLGNSYQARGAWGAYVFLPSGNLLASDIEHGLFIVTPTFPLRDCQSDVSISGTFDHYWDFTSNNRLETSAQFGPNALITMSAPQEVTLEAGFEVSDDTDLSILNRDNCNGTSAKKIIGKAAVK